MSKIIAELEDLTSNILLNNDMYFVEKIKQSRRKGQFLRIRN